MANYDSLVLNELTESGGNLRPSIQVEHTLAEIKDIYQTSPLAKIPFTEIAALGGTFFRCCRNNGSSGNRRTLSLCFPQRSNRNISYGKGWIGCVGNYHK